MRDVVVRLRDKLPTGNSEDHVGPPGGLRGEDLENIVALDAMRRSGMDVNDIYVSDDPDGIRDILHELPKGPSGKIQRLKLADILEPADR